MNPVRRILGYPFVVAYFVLQVAIEAPLQFLFKLLTQTAALVQTGDATDARMPSWMLTVLVRLQAVMRYDVTAKSKPRLVMAHIYCEAQGPSAGTQDHLIGKSRDLPPLNALVLTGSLDSFGGQRVLYNGSPVNCPTCNAPLRHAEVSS